MVTNRTNAKVKEVQKSINRLQSFRLKSGKLVENGVIDEKTKNAIKEFVTACQQNKLINFLKMIPITLL